ncbi:MAG: A/G-specific adenine glycosylase [Butyribacter sp.]|nr:A/G-specific adenine glycosylase [bacterium]MDY3853349.1 A/G-specific adenine glycosylase [Butyribacter sp.]
MKEVVQPLLQWYAKNKRSLPWRETKNPYHIWISEIMLQQTRVEAVREYYFRFLQRLPSVEDLAMVSDDELMKLWQGLGYYNRARNLKKAANVIVEEHGGSFPEKYEELLQLPGIGEYTAGAIASIAFGEPVPAVDGNVYRIYTRLKADKSDIMQGKTKKKIREEIAGIVPQRQSGEFNQAWMDLGAEICIPNGMPLCDKCPLSSYCMARRQQNMLDFPVKTKKKPRRIEEKTVFLLEYQGKYLIQQRPDKGLLAGLWEFPSQEGKLSLKEVSSFVKKWGGDAGQIELLGSGKHIFSHVEWHMLGYRIHLEQIPEELKENLVLSSVEELDKKYSIPSAYSVYLQKIFSDRLHQ